VRDLDAPIFVRRASFIIWSLVNGQPVDNNKTNNGNEWDSRARAKANNHAVISAAASL
jgi:hypothetical protein